MPRRPQSVRVPAACHAGSSGRHRLFSIFLFSFLRKNDQHRRDRHERTKTDRPREETVEIGRFTGDPQHTVRGMDDVDQLPTQPGILKAWLIV